MRKILSYFFILSMPFLQWLNTMVNRTLTSAQRSKRLTTPMPMIGQNLCSSSHLGRLIEDNNRSQLFFTSD